MTPSNLVLQTITVISGHPAESTIIFQIYMKVIELVFVSPNAIFISWKWDFEKKLIFEIGFMFWKSSFSACQSFENDRNEVNVGNTIKVSFGSFIRVFHVSIIPCGHWSLDLRFCDPVNRDYRSGTRVESQRFALATGLLQQNLFIFSLRIS